MSIAWPVIAAQCDIIADEDTTRPRTWNLRAEPQDPAEWLRLVEGLGGIPKALTNCVHYSKYYPMAAGLSDRFRSVTAPDGYVKSVQFDDDESHEQYRAYLAGL